MKSDVKKWYVIMDAEKAPRCGDWIAVSGLHPGAEETARFCFLDGTRADGLTFLDTPQDQPGAPHDGENIPWLHFPDCMEIIGVTRQEWCPPNRPHDRRLWRLTVVSLPSNVEFEKRLFARHEKDKRGSQRNYLPLKILRW